MSARITVEISCELTLDHLFLLLLLSYVLLEEEGDAGDTGVLALGLFVQGDFGWALSLNRTAPFAFTGCIFGRLDIFLVLDVV